MFGRYGTGNAMAEAQTLNFYGRTFTSAAEVRKFESERRASVHPDAPPVPDGKIPREGVEYGCGKPECDLCYREVVHGI